MIKLLSLHPSKDRDIVGITLLLDGAITLTIVSAEDLRVNSSDGVPTREYLDALADRIRVRRGMA